MPVPILLFAAAGALAGGGLGGSVYLWKKGAQIAADDERRKDIEHAKNLIHKQTELAEVRKAAEAAGVDPDAVLSGYEAIRDGYFSLPEVASKFYAGKAPVPFTEESTLPAGLSPGETTRATAAEIRAWARDAGYEVADRGPVPRHILEAYQDARVAPE